MTRLYVDLLRAYWNDLNSILAGGIAVWVLWGAKAAAWLLLVYAIVSFLAALSLYWRARALA